MLTEDSKTSEMINQTFLKHFVDTFSGTRGIYQISFKIKCSLPIKNYFLNHNKDGL